jgi:hypothetical protein
VRGSSLHPQDIVESSPAQRGECAYGYIPLMALTMVELRGQGGRECGVRVVYVWLDNRVLNEMALLRHLACRARSLALVSADGLRCETA